MVLYHILYQENRVMTWGYDYINQGIPAMKQVMTWAISKFFEMLPQQLPPETVGKALSILIAFLGVLWIIGLFLFWKDHQDDE